ncbi:MAG: efflux RND transporter permease subunit [Rickettsiales bacterium]|jgi:HAE1 family hydrophobic/amphiphilic exporter-1|nr:efflux RND transporter permease subunit [Rickettsiales bacterium]
MKFIEFFVKRPITTIMFVLMWVVLGIVAFPKMNVERMPAIDFPMVTASFIYPGASPAEIESQVVKRAEDAISEVSGVKRIQSQAFENGGFVMAEFNIGANVNDKASEIKAKLDAVSGEFPDDLKAPIVEKLNPLQQSVVDIVMTGADPKSLDIYIKDTLANKITAIPGVSGVSVFGGENRAVRIAMNPELMAAHGVAASDVVSALGSYNLNVPGGRIESDANSQAVRFVGEFQSLADIENLRITTPEGDNFRLSQIAQVSDGVREVERGARFNGEKVVILSVVKSNDGNAIKISNQLQKQLPQLQSSMQAVFPDARMQIISDSSRAVSAETNITLRDIILGVILTVATLLAFTRNWRTTIIAGVMIPASLIAGFFFMDASGFTINVMTMLAIATALGTLITDAIVMIESALGLLNRGYSPENAAIEGTKKVSVRVFATIGVHIVVFLPLAFMNGIVGQFMAQFGLTVVYLVLLSSMFSFTLTPMMIAKILRKTKNQKTETTKLKWFRPFYDWQIKHPWRAVGIAAAAMVITIIPMRWVGNEFSPSTDTNEISVSVRAPMGSNFAKSEGIARKMEEVLAGVPEIKSVAIKIGERGIQNISGKLELVPHDRRGLTDKQLAQKILPLLAAIPDAEVQIRAGESMSGAGVSSDMVLNINGENDDVREKYAGAVLEVLNQIPEIQSAVRAQQTPGLEIKFIPDSGAMSFWGVKNAAAGGALRTALFGNDNYKFKENGREYPIILEFAKPYKGVDLFNSVFISSPKGLVRLNDLGRIESASATPDIVRLDKNRITQININLGKSTIGPVQTKIESAMKKLDWQPGYYAKFGGMSEIQGETQGEIGRAFLLASILTFMLLAAVMNSARQPFTIITGIITSFTGVFIMLFLTGANINIAAMLAIVMLVGLAVNTNILLLEPTLEEMARGARPTAALWEQFCDKHRMLMMATIAVVAGLIPQLFSIDGMKLSMGAVIIGGIAASLFWTYAATPAIFVLMERAWKRKK